MNEEPIEEPIEEPPAVEEPTEPVEPAPTNDIEQAQLDSLLEIQAILDNIETLVQFSVIVGGALFVCWIIKKAIDPLLS